MQLPCALDVPWSRSCSPVRSSMRNLRFCVSQGFMESISLLSTAVYPPASLRCPGVYPFKVEAKTMSLMTTPWFLAAGCNKRRSGRLMFVSAAMRFLSIPTHQGLSSLQLFLHGILHIRVSFFVPVVRLPLISLLPQRLLHSIL